MAYEKQTWIPYDDNKTEEQNIQNGAVVTAERINHLETGLDEHDQNTSNPHKVTKAQVGLGNVTNVEQAPKTDFTSHTSNKTNPHGVTKGQVGLGNVTNVEQASKTEYDSHVADKTNPHSVTKAQVNLGNVDNYATANQTDSEQGLAGNKFITPMGVKQHVDSRMATQEEVDTGEATDKIVSPKTLAEWKKEQLIERGKQIVLGENRQVADPTTPNFGKFGISDNYRAGTFKDNQPYFTVNSDGEVVVSEAGQYLISGVCKRQFRTSVTLWHYVSLVHKDATSGSETKLDMFPFGGAIQNRSRQSGQQIRQCKVGDKFWCVSESNNTTNALQFINMDFFTMERLGD
ncbi:hypothetical protein SAMN04487821_13033 [Enterococcus malodoratus]|uniref:hypothetical protein n=1 Tax=Enterococcus malodoratus TaxID=71451 RepID=UPI0008C82E88|nr:hypothetical protein [Enterococcus malodoratus]SET93387.1 hypothetical protein SAMN04487821_13033 [Enterococcus malodoratus]